MRIKTFYAKNMQAALRLVKEQLGPEALILSSRELPHRGSGRAAAGIEIVAAADGDMAGLEPDSFVSGPTAHSQSLRRQTVLDVQDTCFFSGVGPEETGRPIEEDSRNNASRVETKGLPAFPDSIRCSATVDEESVSRAHEWLLAREINDSLASRILDDACSALSTGGPADFETLKQAVAAAARKLVADASAAGEVPAKRMVIFVGPTGVGKTTSIAKLAARLSLKHRKKIVLITLDGYRIGAVEQLRTYAGLLAVPFRFVQCASELMELTVDYSQRDFILIDTVGQSPRNMEPLLELGRSLSGCGDVECHLVLSATTKSRDIQDVIARFDCCTPSHLLFTKLDETKTLGPVLNELVRTGRPLRYYSDGQRVPEDFHVAARDRIVDLILN